jgi:cytochrome P450 family 9
MLNFHIIPSRATNFFRALVHDTMKTRDHEGIVRPDLIQLLMQAKKGTLQDERSPARGKTGMYDNMQGHDII